MRSSGAKCTATCACNSRPIRSADGSKRKVDCASATNASTSTSTKTNVQEATVEHLRCQKVQRKRYGSGQRAARHPQGPAPASSSAQPSLRHAAIGDWEEIPSSARATRGVLVTLVEAQVALLWRSNWTLATVPGVTEAVIALLPLKSLCQTITFDNNKRFAEPRIHR